MHRLPIDQRDMVSRRANNGRGRLPCGTISSSSSRRTSLSNQRNREEDSSTLDSDSQSEGLSACTATPADLWVHNLEAKQRMQQDHKEFERFVKNRLFPKLKMITSDAQLVHDNRPNSACQWVIEQMHVGEKHKIAFWDLCKGKINAGLKARRNDINTNMKKKFMGKR